MLMQQRTEIRAGMLEKRFTELELGQEMLNVQEQYQTYQEFSNRLAAELRQEMEEERRGKLRSEQQAMPDFFEQLAEDASSYLARLSVDTRPSTPQQDVDDFDSFEAEVAEMDDVILKIQQQLNVALDKRTNIIGKYHTSLNGEDGDAAAAAEPDQEMVTVSDYQATPASQRPPSDA